LTTDLDFRGGAGVALEVERFAGQQWLRCAGTPEGSQDPSGSGAHTQYYYP